MISTAEKDDEGTIWWRNSLGQVHRENGPAVEYKDGYKSWWQNGVLHREDGPAQQWPDRSGFYYLNGETGPEIKQKVKENMARIQAQKDQQELLSNLSQDNQISAKINTSSLKIPKKI